MNVSDRCACSVLPKKIGEVVVDRNFIGSGDTKVRHLLQIRRKKSASENWSTFDLKKVSFNNFKDEISKK